MGGEDAVGWVVGWALCQGKFWRLVFGRGKPGFTGWRWGEGMGERDVPLLASIERIEAREAARRAKREDCADMVLW